MSCSFLSRIRRLPVLGRIVYVMQEFTVVVYHYLQVIFG